jgi:hypothetical protein
MPSSQKCLETTSYDYLSPTRREGLIYMPPRTTTAKKSTAKAQELDSILISGACEHNLKNIDVEIPKKKLVILT